MSADRFDQAYYDRFYGHAETRVHGVAEIDLLARAVVGLITYWGYPLRSAIDVGAGTGLWGAWFAEHRPDVRFRSSDFSAHACATYGHDQRDLTAWHDDEAHDLVICHGVLDCIDDAGCERAVANLAAMTRGFLFCVTKTDEDVRDRIVDPERSDVGGYRRPASFYVRLLDDYFVRIGAGLWLTHTARMRLMALERADLV